MVQPHWAAAGSKIGGENDERTTEGDGFRSHSRNTRRMVKEHAESRGLVNRIYNGERDATGVRVDARKYNEMWERAEQSG